MDLASNNPQRLICHKTQQNKPNLSIYLSIYLSGPYLRLTRHLYIYLSIWPISTSHSASIYLSIYLAHIYVSLGIYLSIYLSCPYLCVSRCPYLSIHLSIYLSIYLSIIDLCPDVDKYFGSYILKYSKLAKSVNKDSFSFPFLFIFFCKSPKQRHNLVINLSVRNCTGRANILTFCRRARVLLASSYLFIYSFFSNV